jgi:hypothetical protein
MTGSEVKKKYDRLLKAEVARLKAEAVARGEKYRSRIFQMSGEECRPAGDAALRELCGNVKTQEEIRRHPGLRLYQLDITMEDGSIMQRAKLVGEVRP